MDADEDWITRRCQLAGVAPCTWAGQFLIGGATTCTLLGSGACVREKQT